jgi:hypothetical protein
MCGQAIDQNIFPKVLGTAQVLYCPKPTAEGNRTLELLPVPMEIFFGLNTFKSNNLKVFEGNNIKGHT